MAKFILQGGGISKSDDKGEPFFIEFLKSKKETLHVLDCMFSRPEAEWASRLLYDKGFFQKCASGKTLEVRLAEPDTFVEQIRWADAVYVCGGNDKKLLETLKQNLSWANILDEKIVAGSSAGADMISKYFYNLDTLQIEEGLGLMPIKFIPHYRSDYNAPNVDWDKAEDELKKYKEDLPLVTLREGEFKVFTQ